MMSSELRVGRGRKHLVRSSTPISAPRVPTTIAGNCSKAGHGRRASVPLWGKFVGEFVARRAVNAARRARVHGVACVLRKATRPTRTYVERHMNWNTIEAKWDQVKGDVKSKWGKLTDDDMAAAGG